MRKIKSTLLSFAVIFSSLSFITASEIRGSSLESLESLGVENLSKSDKAFLRAHPDLPRENFHCTLENYDPETASQTEALKWVHRLLNLPKGRPAGLWLWGDVGIGKSHLSVAAAKAFEERGGKVFFTNDFLHKGVRELKYDVFVIDDINSFFGVGENFRKLILHAFNSGKIVLLTSNTPYEEILPQAFVTSRAELPRYQDRIRNMIKVLNILGKSQRFDSSWINDFEDEKTKFAVESDKTRGLQPEDEPEKPVSD